jgi:hypothetical protein
VGIVLMDVTRTSFQRSQSTQRIRVRSDAVAAWAVMS